LSREECKRAAGIVKAAVVKVLAKSVGGNIAFEKGETV
jgi:hypothetical protein